MIRNILALFGLGVFFVVCSVVSLKWLPVPWVWIPLSLGLACFTLKQCSGLTRIRTLLSVVMIGALTFLLTEVFVYKYIAAGQSKKRPKLNFSREPDETRVIEDPILGHRAHPNLKYLERLVVNREKVYEVTYSIDSKGLRVTPQYPMAQAAVLFFGGSFVFGSGVEDSEVVAFQVGSLLGESFQSYNFGFLGYGAHQMLAMLEFNQIDQVVRQKRLHGFYQGIIHHVRRSERASPWDWGGPRYEIESGIAKYKGPLVQSVPLRERMTRQLLKSHIINRFHGLDNPLGLYSRKRAIEKYVGILARSRDLFLSRYPNSQFHILFWDDWRYPDMGLLLDRMRSQHLSVSLMSDVLGYENVEDPRWFLKYDGHPTVEAHRRITQHVLMQVRTHQSNLP